MSALDTLKKRLGPDLAASRLTLVIIAVNVVAYLAEVVLAGDPRAVLSMTEHQRVVLAAGGNYDPFVIGEQRFELLVTSCFLHWSLVHIGFNMYALRQVGPFVEKAVGPARFAPMYLASGILGSAASALWSWNRDPTLSVGASGAICGLIGTALVIGGRLEGWRGPIVRSMAIWLGLTIAIGYWINADNAAHIGGAATGAAFATVWKRGVAYTSARQKATLGVCAAVVVLSFAVLVVRDLTDPWATRDLGMREAIALSALERGRCTEARLATERAARIAPRSPIVEKLRRDVLATCGG